VTLRWRALSPDDLPAIVALASRVLAADGGMPLVADEPFLRRRFLVVDGAVGPDGGATAFAASGIVGVDADHRLRAAAAVRPPGLAVGLVDPAVRGQGHGAHLVDWALATGPSATVEIEALTDAAAALFASRGLSQTWAEDVMRYDLSAPPPPVSLPADVSVEPWTDATRLRFFATYEAAFRDRPGFPHWSAEQWVEWTTDDEFRPDWSLLAVDPAAGDVGFVTAGEGWIVQVGVRPDARGRAIGAGLVVESMRRMRAAGASEVLLDVNVDNPAGDVYRRLGFTTIGRRARFTRP
jgi:mycothiol synthase